ncbi:unnamed protein product [Macrosiphum euphorbiae]|uniref:MADF domain-containing protein n=1 Tax=Macrosiphum euphorbiae TaxID=13131 RepID=A0AAV0Y5M9_9HEMI|nr:unnamed protein product [Macrosiphum euphorbiae]
MEWCNVDCIQLIQEYQQEEVLWNPKHAFYFSKTKKQDAWEEIGKKLNKNPEEVKKKALSLLGSYRREKAKGKKTMGTGTGRKDVYVSKWFAFEAFQFLLDRDDPRPTLSTDNEDVLNESGDVHDSDDLPECELTQQEQEINPESFSIPEQPTRKKKKTQVSDKCIEDAIEILKRPYPTLSTPDDWSVYGQHLANKLRKYTPHASSIVQHYFNNILFEADMGKFDLPNSHVLQQPQYPNFNSYSTPSATFSQSSPLSSTTSPYHYTPVTSLSPNEPLHEFHSPVPQTAQTHDSGLYNHTETQPNSFP